MKKKKKKTKTTRPKRVTVPLAPSSPPVVENQTPVCFCGRRGIYTGCSPAGSSSGPLRIAFKCECGKVWGFLAPRGDLGKYRS